jgi:hypothetical protein
MTREQCVDCGREARYLADIGGAMCSRHAQVFAHLGHELAPIGTCGHVATLADMVARRPCTMCRHATTCRHCGRGIELDSDGRWVNPDAHGDDSIWRETCEDHDTFAAEHEPS